MTTQPRTAATAEADSASQLPTPPGAWRVGLARGAIEIRQFLRDRSQVVFTFSLPAVLMVLFASIFDGQIKEAGITASQMYVGSMIGAGLMSTSFQSLGISIAVERDQNVLRRLRGTPMPPTAYFLGKLWLVLCTGVAETVLLLAVGTWFFDLDLPDDPARWLTLGWVFVLGLVSCSLLGIAASSVPRSGTSASSVIVFPYLVLQFVSGVYIAVDTVPDWMLGIGALFPLKWMCQGFRGVFLPDQAKVLEQAGAWEYGRIAVVLGLWCVAGLVLCLTTFRWKSRRDG